MRQIHLLPKFFSLGLEDHTFVKVITGLATALLNFLLPTSVLINMTVIAAVFVLLDTLSGIIAATVQGEPITSKRFGHVVVKYIGYAIGVAVVGLAARGLPGASSAHEFLQTLLLGSIMATEALSIAENLHRMGVPLPPGFVRWLNGRKKMLEQSTPPMEDINGHQSGTGTGHRVRPPRS